MIDTGREPAEAPYCAWCIYRDGDLCTQARSPVNRRFGRAPGDWLRIGVSMLLMQPLPGIPDRSKYLPGECGPVCYGETPCQYRLERHRRR
jgi:hypothetical protein